MSGTQRTQAYLLNQFKPVASGGTIKSAQDMEDLIASVYGRVTVSALDFSGVDPTGVADSTTGINNAITAATGGICFLPVGKYLLSANLVMPSNTWLMGSGYGTWIYTTAGTGFNFVLNQNYAATFSAATKVDQNILVSGIRFDFGSLNDGATKAVSFRMAQNCTVRDCWSSGGNNFTAMLACIGTLVDNCHMAIGATGFSNCAYDHWDGAQDFTVRDCSATMVGGNGLLCTGTGTIGTEVRTTSRGLFDNVTITGGGVGLYMNAGFAGCAVTNVTARNLRFIGTAGGVVADGPGGQHTIENIYWISGGSSGSGDCAVSTRFAVGGVPNDCFIDKIHVISSQTAVGNVGIIQIGGSRHEIGSVNCVGAAITNGTLFYFTTNSNLCVIRGPVTADASSISAITFGMYQGNGGAFDTNTQIMCWDPFNSYYRLQGAGVNFQDAATFSVNRGLLLVNQTSSAGASTGTLTNAPAAGNPGYWLKVNVNGTNYTIPCWPG